MTHLPPESPYYRHARPEVAPLLPRDVRRVLDVGCGAGAFAGHFAAGTEVWGIEPGAAAEDAGKRLHRVLRGLYHEVEGELPAAHFDVIVCNDVIEHMADPDAFLRSARTKLAPGGCLVGSIPNVRFVKTLFGLLVLKDWRYEDAGVMDRTHLRFFTERSLRRLFREHGFAVQEMRGLNSALTLVRGAPSLAKAVVTMLLIAITLGAWADIRFQQWGFRVSPAPPAS